jgi:hypothetical protein
MKSGAETGARRWGASPMCHPTPKRGREDVPGTLPRIHEPLFSFASPELLGEPDEKPLGSANVAQPIRLLVLHKVADELRTVLLEPGERLVDIFDGEHDA